MSGSVVYRLCERTDGPQRADDGPAKTILTLEPAEDPAAFERACEIAEGLSADVYQVTQRLCPDPQCGDSTWDHLCEATGPVAEYVVSMVGGTPHWWLPGTTGAGLHQIGSAGFCWTCLRPDDLTDRPGSGLVRHPVTPGEIGQPEAACFVCDVILHRPEDPAEPEFYSSMHRDVDHTVIWGEETHPRCKSCGGGYQIATPEGIGYVEHSKTCRELYGPLEEG